MVGGREGAVTEGRRGGGEKNTEERTKEDTPKNTTENTEGERRRGKRGVWDDRYKGCFQNQAPLLFVVVGYRLSPHRKENDHLPLSTGAHSANLPCRCSPRPTPSGA